MVLARRVGVAVLLAVILATTGCSSNTPAAPVATGLPTSDVSSYVALGDSYAAGPGIDPVDPQSGTCQRSINNWPTLLAKELRIPSFTDVTCSGATTNDVITGRLDEESPPPQIDAVTPTTDLVTLAVGGNDENVFGNTIVDCLAGAVLTRGTCSPIPQDELDAIAARTAGRITSAVERIRTTSPKAQIVLVGYLRTLPEPNGCIVPGLAPADFAAALAGQTAIEAAITAAAKRAKVEFVSLNKPSIGHESCSGTRAWVNGMQPTPGDGAFLHPTAAGMKAVAKILATHLR